MDHLGNSVEDINLIYFRLSNAISLLTELKNYINLCDEPFVTSAMTEIKQIIHRCEEGKVSKEVGYKSLAPIIQELNEYVQVMAITKLFQETRRMNDLLIGVSKWSPNEQERARQYSHFTHTSSDSGSDSDDHWQRLAELRQEMLGESSICLQRKPLPTHSQRVDEILTLLQGKDECCDAKKVVTPHEEVEVEKSTQKIYKPSRLAKSVSSSASDLDLPQSCAPVDKNPEETEEPLKYEERADKILQSIDKKLRGIEIRQRQRMENKSNRINDQQMKREKRRQYREQIDKDYKHADGRVSVSPAQVINNCDGIIPCGKRWAEKLCQKSGKQEKPFEKRNLSGTCKLKETRQNNKLQESAVEQQPVSKTSHHVTWATPLHRLVWPNPP